MVGNVLRAEDPSARLSEAMVVIRSFATDRIFHTFSFYSVTLHVRMILL